MRTDSLPVSVAGLPATTRRADSGNQAGRADLINIVSFHSNDPDVLQAQFGMMVTSIRANNGRIKLITWRLSSDGEVLERLGDSGSSGEPVNGIAAGRLSLQRMVTAVRTNQGRLKLIVWRISDDGQAVEVLGESTAEDEIAITSSELSVVVMGAGQVVTVSQDSDNRLLVTNWGILHSEDAATINRAGDSGLEGSVVTEFAADRIFLGRVITAARSANGQLILQDWATPSGPDAADVALLGSSALNAAGDGRQISMTIGGEIITAVRTLEGNLKLIRWNGGLQRLGDSAQQGEPASRTSIVRMISDRYMSAVRGTDGLLKVSTWRVLPTAETIQKLSATAPSAQEPVGQVAIAPLFSGFAVTAIQDGNGQLKLITWQL